MTNKNIFVRFVVNKEQYERLCFNAKARGFVSLSAYMRDMTLRNGLYIETKLTEIDKKLSKLDDLIVDLQQKGILRQTQIKEKTKTARWYQELQETGMIN